MAYRSVPNARSDIIDEPNFLSRIHLPLLRCASKPTARRTAFVCLWNLKIHRNQIVNERTKGTMQQPNRLSSGWVSRSVFPSRRRFPRFAQSREDPLQSTGDINRALVLHQDATRNLTYLALTNNQQATCFPKKGQENIKSTSRVPCLRHQNFPWRQKTKTRWR